MDPASSARSRFREAMADVPQKPSRGHCCNGFLHRPNAHVWCSVLLFRHRPRPAEDPAFQCDAKSQCTLGYTAIARSMGLQTAAQILAIRPRRKFGAEVVSAVRDMGSEPTRTAFRSPWQNGVAERWVGSCRRDLLDHVIILNERHLNRLMLLPTCFIITRTGRISDSRRTRQQVGLQKCALRVKGRFNPFRDSVACTIVMRWQRRFKSCFSESQILFETRTGTVHVLCEHFRGSTNQHAIPNRRTSAKEKEILLMWCTTIWRTTSLRKVLSAPPAQNSRDTLVAQRYQCPHHSSVARSQEPRDYDALPWRTG